MIMKGYQLCCNSNLKKTEKNAGAQISKVLACLGFFWGGGGDCIFKTKISITVTLFVKYVGLCIFLYSKK